jgi:hypothetical protein
VDSCGPQFFRLSGRQLLIPVDNGSHRYCCIQCDSLVRRQSAQRGVASTQQRATARGSPASRERLGAPVLGDDSDGTSAGREPPDFDPVRYPLFEFVHMTDDPHDAPALT